MTDGVRGADMRPSQHDGDGTTEEFSRVFLGHHRLHLKVTGIVISVAIIILVITLIMILVVVDY